MAEATDATLTSLAENGPIKSLRIEAVRETADSRYLGVVGISLLHPIFHVIDGFPFSGELSPDSRYMLRKLTRPGHDTMVFVLFRQFDSSRYSASPEDLVAGWVPLDEEAQALRWVERMNWQIQAFAVTDHDAPEPINKSFVVRARFAGTLQALGEHVERRLGLRFRQAHGRAYDDLPALEAAGLGMTIRLIEFPAVASYPRRFHLAGSTEPPPGVDSPKRDVTSDIRARLEAEGVEWYIPTREELDTEAGL